MLILFNIFILISECCVLIPANFFLVIYGKFVYKSQELLEEPFQQFIIFFEDKSRL